MLNKSIKTLLLGAMLAFTWLPAQAETLDVDALLELVKKGQARDNQAFNERIQRFRDENRRQDALLKEAAAQKAALEQQSAQKEKQFADNEVAITEAQERLTNRLGSLKELFGVLQQVAGDSKSLFEVSATSAELPGRDQFLTGLIKKAGSSSTLPSMDELEQLWFEMQREMTYSGRVSRFDAEVVLPSGDSQRLPVVRVGNFNVVANGKYLNYDSELGKLVELPGQPAGRYTAPISDLESAGSGMVDFWIDPARGQLLAIMGQSATLGERIDQGGVVGYVILALAVVGILLALLRMAMLASESVRIKRQMASDSPSDDNALGRVMKVYQDNTAADIETLELHLAEAIAAEIPKLTRGINWIKIISVVAPLLGLLGTVTGMIDVFETMALFGTGDPKLMAGGISQALVTTVLGLVAAIPCVFLHTMTNNRSRALILVLEERATGILARKAEMQQARAA
ncbi:MAG TPA: MotA/TolQ/ExbB proton channel family protein [Pseudomonadales bacterium]